MELIVITKISKMWFILYRDHKSIEHFILFELKLYAVISFKKLKL